MTKLELSVYQKSLMKLAASLDRSLSGDQREMLRLEEPDVSGGSLKSTEDEANDGLLEVELGLINNESNLLSEVNAALGRLNSGTFGACETCGRQITRARLNAIPYARHCISCARGAESAGK
jgi:DnaK suppressor protein